MTITVNAIISTITMVYISLQIIAFKSYITLQTAISSETYDIVKIMMCEHFDNTKFK